MRIWKICHSYPGCSFIWNLRVEYFTVKHSYLCNKSKYITAWREKVAFGPLLRPIFIKRDNNTVKKPVSLLFFLWRKAFWEGFRHYVMALSEWKRNHLRASDEWTSSRIRIAIISGWTPRTKRAKLTMCFLFLRSHEGKHSAGCLSDKWYNSISKR